MRVPHRSMYVFFMGNLRVRSGRRITMPLISLYPDFKKRQGTRRNRQTNQEQKSKIALRSQSVDTFIFSILISLRRVVDRGSTSPSPHVAFAPLCATNSSATPPYSSTPSTPRPKTQDNKTNRKHACPRHTPYPFDHEDNSQSPSVPRYGHL